MIHFRNRSLAWKIRPCFSSLGGRRIREHIMGVVVRDTTMEITMATDRVTANSRNRRPTMPPMSRMGMKTAMREMLMEITVKPISLAPWREASMGVMPSSRCRVMFSTTTMASSTTKPVATVSAIRERLSMV